MAGLCNEDSVFTAQYELHLQTKVQQRLHAIFNRLGQFPNYSRNLKFPSVHTNQSFAHVSVQWHLVTSVSDFI